jgi:putative ABC transport system permease protein
VVGEVADVRHWSLDIDLEPTAYYPYTQVPDKLIPLVEKTMSVAVRTAGPGADILPSLRSAVTNVHKDAPVFGVQTMNQMLADSGSLRRFDLLLLGTFAALALSLAAVGVYGVIAYWVSQRTREIGIRMAMGARRRDVLELVVLHGLKIGILGIIFGVAGALALSRVMSSLLYGVSSTDPATFALVAVMVGVVVLFASLVPARRATRVDPMVALRYE